MRRIGVAQRRARLGLRHGLAAAQRPSSALETARHVVALHATDPATVYLSVLARVPDAEIGDIAAALYDDRSLVRLLGMRRTMFVVPADDVPVVHHAASREIADRLRRQILKHLAEPTDPPLNGDPAEYLAEVEAAVVAVLDELGEATGQQLSTAEPRLRIARPAQGTGKAWDVRQPFTSRILTLMAAEGRIVRSRPMGTWLSRIHTWAPGHTFWPDGLPDIPVAEARAELVRRWLARYGPATVTDLQWWTGWTLGATRKALADVSTVEVVIDTGDGDEPGLVLAGDDADVPEPERPWAALLPALDPTPMGWKSRAWYLGTHKEALFDRNGNIGPSVWVDGRIVGGWALRKTGDIAIRYLEDVGAEARDLVDQEAASLHERLGGAVVIPSFRTPLEKDLAAS